MAEIGGGKGAYHHRRQRGIGDDLQRSEYVEPSVGNHLSPERRRLIHRLHQGAFEFERGRVWFEGQ